MHNQIVLYISFAFIVFTFGCSSNNDSEKKKVKITRVKAENYKGPHKKRQLTEKERLNKKSPTGTYGKGLQLKQTVTVDELLASSDKHAGKMVQVSGIVTDVCPKRGCWIQLKGEKSTETIRVKVRDGHIVFPLSSIGAKASVLGKLEKKIYSEKKARAFQKHIAEEKKIPFDPSSVKGGMVFWQVGGIGAQMEM